MKQPQRNRPGRESSNTGNPPLRKQPPLKKQGGGRRGRVSAAVPAGQIYLPRTAAQRRRRNRIPFTFPTQTVLGIITSPRWISLAVLVVMVYFLQLLATRSDFYLRYIPVDGLVSIPADEIVATSGLAGRHVFAVDPNVAARRIAEMPGIVSASVTLKWPNRVNISIVEDTPIAVWMTPDQSFWINEQGQLLPARIDVPGLIHIRSENTRGLIGVPAKEEAESAGPAADDGEAEDIEEEVAETPPPKTSGAVPTDILLGALILQKLQPNGTTLLSLNYHPSNGLSYQDERGWPVFLGTGTDMRQKLTIYRAIVDDLLTQGITPQYVSVTNKEKPFFMAAR